MSASLLQKSLKLSEENKTFKKKSSAKKKFRESKWKRTISKLNEEKEKEIKDNTLSNIKKLEELDSINFVEISEKILSRKIKSTDIEDLKEEQTVFSDKDFEEFEKEYFAS